MPFIDSDNTNCEILNFKAILYEKLIKMFSFQFLCFQKKRWIHWWLAICLKIETIYVLRVIDDQSKKNPNEIFNQSIKNYVKAMMNKNIIRYKNNIIDFIVKYIITFLHKKTINSLAIQSTQRSIIYCFYVISLICQN